MFALEIIFNMNKQILYDVLHARPCPKKKFVASPGPAVSPTFRKQSSAPKFTDDSAHPRPPTPSALIGYANIQSRRNPRARRLWYFNWRISADRTRASTLPVWLLETISRPIIVEHFLPRMKHATRVNHRAGTRRGDVNLCSADWRDRGLTFVGVRDAIFPLRPRILSRSV